MTLVELVVISSVIVILVIALGFAYQGWMGRYKVESAMNTLYSDLMDARARAMDRDITFLGDFPTATTYRIGNDTNGNGVIDAGEVLPTFPKAVGYGYSPNAAFASSTDGGVTWTVTPSAITGVIITLNNRGGITVPALSVDPSNPLDQTTNRSFISITSQVNPPDNDYQTVNPDYNCIVLSATRVARGQMVLVPGSSPHVWVCNEK